MEASKDQSRAENSKSLSLSSRNNFENEKSKYTFGLSEEEDRFYSLGSFKSGPTQSLIAKLLNISKKDNLDNLVILAKSKSTFAKPIDVHPVIFDMAHVFEKNSDMLVDKEAVKIAEELTEEVTKKLEDAIDEKKMALTSDEIDDVIEQAIDLVSILQFNFIKLLKILRFPTIFLHD